jgi:hypothetical protein
VIAVRMCVCGLQGETTRALCDARRHHASVIGTNSCSDKCAVCSFTSFWISSHSFIIFLSGNEIPYLCNGGEVCATPRMSIRERSEETRAGRCTGTRMSIRERSEETRAGRCTGTRMSIRERSEETRAGRCTGTRMSIRERSEETRAGRCTGKRSEETRAGRCTDAHAGMSIRERSEETRAGRCTGTQRQEQGGARAHAGGCEGCRWVGVKSNWIDW